MLPLTTGSIRLSTCCADLIILTIAARTQRVCRFVGVGLRSRLPTYSLLAFDGNSSHAEVKPNQHVRWDRSSAAWPHSPSV